MSRVEYFLINHTYTIQILEIAQFLLLFHTADCHVEMKAIHDV